MNLLKLTLHFAGWLRSLLRKVGRLTPGYLILTISLFTISQISSFLAFFLPLKVIILVATEGIPRYLQLIVTQESKEAAIVLFAIGAVFFYLLNLLTEHLAKRYSHNAGTRLLARSKKLTLFGNEVQLAREVFLRLSRSMGGMLMGVGGFVLGFYLNVLLFGALVLIMVLEFMGFGYVWNRVDRQDRLQDRLELIRKTPNILKFFSSLNFFAGFSLLLYVFFTDPGFGLIRGLLSFILMRQVMQRLQGAIQDALYLHQNKPKINALFYTNIFYQPQITPHELGFLDMLRPDNREKWLSPLVKAHGLQPAEAWKWFDLQGKNIALLWARESGNEEFAVYVKIYSPNQQLVHAHETMIFKALGQVSHLVPDPLADVEYQGFNVVVFRGPRPMDIDKKELKQILDQSMLDMWAIVPEPGFVSQCCRTKPVMHQRITEDMIQQLTLAVDDSEERAIVDSLLQSLPVIQEVVASMPLVVCNPGQGNDNLGVDRSGQPMIFAWARWSMEPLGTGLPIKLKKGKIQEMLDKVAEKRPEFGAVKPEAVVLTSMATQLEKYISSHNFKKGVRLAPDLLEKLKACVDDKGAMPTAPSAI